MAVEEDLIPTSVAGSKEEDALALAEQSDSTGGLDE